MNYSFFEKRITYTTLLTQNEIEQKILFLKKKEGASVNRFFVKINKSLFLITPILGTREGLKIIMKGEVLEQNGRVTINIKYTIDEFLRWIIYILNFLVIIFVCGIKIMGKSFVFGDFGHPEYLLIASSLFMLFVFNLIFSSQLKQYSSFISNYLELTTHSTQVFTKY